MDERLKQFLVTPDAGKRLIAKAMLCINEIQTALQNNTVVIIAGTTNGYVAEEVLQRLGQAEGFARKSFFRGITYPPDYQAKPNQLMGDVVIEKGQWMKGKTIFDAADNLGKNDIIIKGANALDLERKQAAIQIGDPKAGTIGVSMQTVFGRRVALYIPAGLEKRVFGDLQDIAKALNAANASGPRLMPVTGTVITELDAVKLISGAEAFMTAAGGVAGAEGSYWLAVRGTEQQLTEFEMVYGAVKTKHV